MTKLEQLLRAQPSNLTESEWAELVAETIKEMALSKPCQGCGSWEAGRNVIIDKDLGAIFSLCNECARSGEWELEEVLRAGD